MRDRQHPSHANAVIAQQLAELLGPPARAAGLEPAMGEFNLGDSEEDFRVPDGGLHRPRGGIWLPTAARRSGLIELGPAELAERIDWP